MIEISSFSSSSGTRQYCAFSTGDDNRTEGESKIANILQKSFPDSQWYVKDISGWSGDWLVIVSDNQTVLATAWIYISWRLIDNCPDSVTVQFLTFFALCTYILGIHLTTLFLTAFHWAVEQYSNTGQFSDWLTPERLTDNIATDWQISDWLTN